MNQPFKSTFLCWLMLMFFSVVKAQDIHFSQFFNNPLSLNPALTGKVNGQFRAIAQYRNQWFGPINGRTTFATPAISFDMPIVFKKDALGVGGIIINDRSASGRLTNFTSMVSLAYHKSLSPNGRHNLALGLQGGYVQKRLDLSRIKFADQFNSQLEFNPAQASREVIENSTGNFDMQLGVFWNSYISKRTQIFAGGALFHLLEPKQHLTREVLEIPRRYVGHGGLEIGINDRFTLLPSVVYMQQAKAQQINSGVSAAITAGDKTVLYLGGYYRHKDSMIPYLGLDYQNWRLGISYDANISALNNTNGSFEVSIMYISRPQPFPAKDLLFCPRF